MKNNECLIIITNEFEEIKDMSLPSLKTRLRSTVRNWSMYKPKCLAG
jgi:hypothetical protein